VTLTKIVLAEIKPTGLAFWLYLTALQIDSLNSPASSPHPLTQNATLAPKPIAIVP
jgi:hypothetical protein